MIAVKKSQRNIPDSLSYQEYKDSLTEVTDLSNPEHKDKIKASIYGAKDVREKLKNLYHNKCAYCETFEPEPEVEHYRPKKRIKEQKGHKGYYWLAYERTNVLPACHDCNKNGVKGNHFPIEGKRVEQPLFSVDGEIDISANHLMSDFLQKEKPLFLNPETPGFNPFSYFQFNSAGRFLPNQPNGSFEYRQAEMTIEIVQLNRDKLYANYRKMKIRKLFNDILKQYHKDFLSHKITVVYFKKQVLKILDYIVENSKPHRQYSFFWSFLYAKFTDYIVSYFKGKHREVFFKFYNEHKIKNQHCT